MSTSAQQCTPTVATGSTAAIALDSRSIAGSGAIGKPGCIRSPNHGSSSQTICGDAGRAQGDGVGQRRQVRPHGRARRREGDVDGHAGPGQRRAERDRSDELPLDRAPQARGRRRRRGTCGCRRRRRGRGR